MNMHSSPEQQHQELMSRELYHNYDYEYFVYEARNFRCGIFMNNMTLLHRIFGEQAMHHIYRHACADMMRGSMRNNSNSMQQNSATSPRQQRDFFGDSMQDFHSLRDYVQSSNYQLWNNLSKYYENMAHDQGHTPNSAYFNP